MADRSQENQQELFREFAPEPQKPERIPGINKTHKPILFSTNIEQLILAGIVAILLACLVFFLGVLRGRSLRDLPARTLTPQAAASIARPYAQPVSQAATRRAPGSPSTTPSVQVPAAAAVMAADPSKPYTIQLVTHKKKEYADHEASLLRRSGYPAIILQKGGYFVVCVGQYANKEEAKRDLKLFANKYKGCFLQRR